MLMAMAQWRDILCAMDKNKRVELTNTRDGNRFRVVYWSCLPKEKIKIWPF